MQPVHSGRLNVLRAAWAALVVGLLYAAVSLYWALGGTWLLDTVGAPFDGQGRAGNGGVILLVWAAVALKIVAAVLPLLALRGLASPVWNRTVWMLAWASSAVLTIYGLMWTAGGLLAQADVIASASRAQAWHAYLWDPWFLVWGLLAAAALLRGRLHRGQTRQPTHNQIRDSRC